MEINRIASLEEIACDYDVVFCDVWGVLHNGIACYQEAAKALAKFRQENGPVIMITNAPRPCGPVLTQLEGLHVPQDTFDRVVTSGDVTRKLIEDINGSIFHIGPDRDYSLYEGLEVTLTKELKEASGVVCTGLFDDRSETPADYIELLASIKLRDLPFICANPDVVVEFGDRLIWCAGALAANYKGLGGTTMIVGKPYQPMYETALEAAIEITGKPIEKSKILAIGDGMMTDIAGATDFGIDVLYISAGIHAAEYGEADNPDHEKLKAFVASQNQSPVAYMPRLSWA